MPRRSDGVGIESGVPDAQFVQGTRLGALILAPVTPKRLSLNVRMRTRTTQFLIIRGQHHKTLSMEGSTTQTTDYVGGSTVDANRSW